MPTKGVLTKAVLRPTDSLSVRWATRLQTVQEEKTAPKLPLSITVEQQHLFRWVEGET